MKLKIGGLLSCLLLVGSLAYAQEQESSDAAQAPTGAEADDAVTEQRQDEIDDLEPGVSTGELVAERRPAARSPEVIDELDLGRTEITGNQELPTVLYIVPWQKSDPGELMARPGNSLLDEVLAPVDRGEFVREVDYYSDLFDAKEEQ